MKKAALLAVLAVAWTAWSAQACTTNAECDDANVCNGAETCQAGVCIPGIGITCNDGSACTLDSCDAIAGCVYTTTTACPMSGKKMRLGAGRELRMGIQTAPDLAGAAFPTNNTDDDPVLNGASLRVYTTAGDVFDNTYPLPKHNWTYFGSQGENRGYRYKDFHNVDGPINTIFLRAGRQNKIKARGPLLNFSLHLDPEPVSVVLRFGNAGRQYCLEYGGRTKFYADVRFAAVAAPQATHCP